jgi:hypothetical protein
MRATPGKFPQKQNRKSGKNHPVSRNGKSTLK